MPVHCLLLLVAAGLTVASAVTGRIPLWIPLFLACLAGMLGCWPLR